MARRETPLQWVDVLENAGMHSARDLADALDVSPQTAIRLIHGEQSSRDTIEAAATALGVTPERIRELRQEVALPPFRLPADADRLSQRQRAAIVAVVRAMLETTDDDPPPSHAVSTARRDRSLAELSEGVGKMPESPSPPRSARRK